jgi:hypothetical protein
MRKLLCGLVATALLLGVTGYVWTGGGDDGRAIVNQAIKAMGGEKNLKKHQSFTFEDKGTYYGMGDGLPYTGKFAVQYPDKYRMEIVGVFVIVLNGDKGWTSGMGEVKEMEKDQFDVQRHDHKAGWIQSILPLTDKAYQLKAAGEEKVDGKAARVVKVSRKDYPEVTLYFDKATNLLVKSEFMTKAADLKFKEVKMENYFSAYKDVEGAQTPFKMVMKRDGKLYVEAEVTEYKTTTKHDPKTFAKPE